MDWNNQLKLISPEICLYSNSREENKENYDDKTTKRLRILAKDTIALIKKNDFLKHKQANISIGNHTITNKRLTKLHMQFRVFEKLTSAYLFQIAQEKSCDYLLIIYVKKFRDGWAEETRAYLAIRENCAINCAIQGVSLIWKIWLAIREFLWSLTNQNAWFVTSFCTQLTPFCNVFKKTALLLTNQSGEMVSCILLGIKQIGKGQISSVKKNNFVCHISYGQYSTLTVMIWSDAIVLA